MKHTSTTLLLLASLTSTPILAQETEQESLEALKARIEQLEKTLDEKINTLADSVENQQSTSTQSNPVHIGGYGEMKYSALDEDGEKIRELDFHRFVLFFGYDFNERIRFVSEFEVEHVVSSASSRGAVELEQAYLEFDLNNNMQLQTGTLLMPIGIINETHEPPTFYGVDRPIVETTIIPSTWWSNGITFIHKMDNGIRYDLMISEGLETEDPNAVLGADPFDLKSGKQKGSFADAFDLAVTGRIRYTGIAGLEVAAYAQYQPDLDQSAEDSYADSATLIGGHIIYQIGSVTTRALYARWDLDGELAEAANKQVQDGGYVEVSWKPKDNWGLFVRQSAWSQLAEVEAQQTDFGVNFYPHKDIVFKADYQMQNDDAGNTDGFRLGMGYQF